MAKTSRYRCTLLSLLFVEMASAAEMPLNMTNGVTDISQQVYDLHMTIFYICCAIGLVVFGAMFWAILHHRKAKGVQPAQFHESTKVEILWTAIPVVILIGMAFPATKTLIAMEDTTDAEVTVLITGSQWKWHYKYLDYPVEYYSLLATPQKQIHNKIAKGENYLLEVDRPLVIPTGRKVRFLTTSDDVIHSWWVPAFAVKKDANPGFINESWAKVNEPGIYRGQCAELCGKDHGFMPVVVVAKAPADFEQWIQQEAAVQTKAKAAELELLSMNMTMPEAMALGEKTYLGYCSACHQASGQGLPGAFPALKGSKMATTATELAAHINIVLNGKSGTAMQAFGKQLTLQEIAAVITYERNAWDNNTGDLVQAAAIHAAKTGKE